MYLRALTPTEEAFAIMNRAYPLCAVVVLHLTDPALTTARLQAAITQLQHSMPFLNLGIRKHRGRLCFAEPESKVEIPLETRPRIDDQAYRSVVEAAVNTTIDEEGPLWRVYHVCAMNEADSEVILAFHHSLVDSAVLRVLLDRLLAFAGSPDRQPEGKVTELGEISDPRYPKAYRGLGLAIRKIHFGSAQMAGEIRYRLSQKTNPIPEECHNATIKTRISEKDTQRILKTCADRGISVNALLNSAVLMATVKHKYHRTQGLFRTMTFADLRRFLDPPYPQTGFGCHLAMMRYSLGLDGSGVLALSQQLQHAISASGRNGDIYLFGAMSAALAKMMLALRSGRMATSALSYIGHLRLQPRYGDLGLRDVSAYITNNGLGPEFSGFGKVLFGRLGLDFTYLASETPKEVAESIVAEIEELISAMDCHDD